MNNPSRLLGLAVAASSLLISHSATAQSVASVDSSLVSQQSCSAAVELADGRSASLRTTKGQFPVVLANSQQAVQVRVRLSGGLPRTVSISALDGGALNAGNTSVALDGTASFSFQPASPPGLYRVLVNDGGDFTLLRFIVADPQNPRLAAGAIQPR